MKSYFVGVIVSPIGTMTPLDLSLQSDHSLLNFCDSYRTKYIAWLLLS